MEQYLREHSVANSTFKLYSRAFDHWRRWTRMQGVTWQLTVPLAEQVHVLSEFIIAGAQFGFGSRSPVRSSTIKLNLCGIRHFLLAAGFDLPVHHPQVRMILKGVGRRDAPRRQKAPVSLAILEACFSTLDLHDPVDQALWGVLCLALFFLLRRSEVVATTRTGFQWFALRASDVLAVDASGVPMSDPNVATAACIRLRGSKTNQGDAPVIRTLERSGHPFMCPVLGVLLLLQARSQLPVTIPVAVFLAKDGVPSCVSAARVATAIQRAARAAGEDPARFSTHSLRAGGATNMYRVGVDPLTIQFHGRWA